MLIFLFIQHHIIQCIMLIFLFLQNHILQYIVLIFLFLQHHTIQYIMLIFLFLEHHKIQYYNVQFHLMLIFLFLQHHLIQYIMFIFLFLQPRTIQKFKDLGYVCDIRLRTLIYHVYILYDLKGLRDLLAVSDLRNVRNTGLILLRHQMFKDSMFKSTLSKYVNMVNGHMSCYYKA